MPRASTPCSTVFGRRLREIRSASGLSQEWIGARIGLDESSARARISRYESGEHDPSEAIARKIAEVLGLPLAYFFCDDDRLAELVRGYAELDEPSRARLAAFVAELPHRTAD